MKQSTRKRHEQEHLDKAEVHGEVVRLYYANEKFSAGQMLVDGQVIRFKMQGMVDEGTRIIAEGSWITDPKWGKQFHVSSYQLDTPMDRQGLINLLSRDKAFSGIGWVRAGKIVDFCGTAEEFVRIVADEPLKLCAVPGVTPEIAQQLHDEWLKRSEFNTTMVALAGWGLTPRQIEKVIKAVGNSAPVVLKENPYLLIDLIDGYGFKRVDALALKAGMAKEAPQRIKAGVVHVLVDEMEDGHTWTFYQDVVQKANTLLVMDCLDSEEKIQAGIEELAVAEKIIVRKEIGNAEGPDTLRVALKGLHEMEVCIGQRFAEVAKLTTPVDATLLETDMSTMNDGQRWAFMMAIQSGVSLITGPGGTGKTYMISKLVQFFEAQGQSVALAAPTGKASRRMVQMTNHPASTIHKLLGYNGNEWDLDENNPLTVDVLIVDEFSMVDVSLCFRLLKALKWDTTRLILVGDHNQLPPVGPGHILRDIINRRLMPVGLLTQVVRQAGALKANSLAILDGHVVGLRQDDPKTDDWKVISQLDDAESVMQAVTHLYENVFDKLKLDPLRDVQLLAPQHNGPIGVKALNCCLQRLLQAKICKFEVPHRDADAPEKLYPGDKVIQTKNDYELGVMNGTVGYVVEVDRGELLIEFDDIGAKSIPSEKRQHIKLAYALTVHKSQGSEYPCVVSIVHSAHTFMQHRNLFYTSVTRASRLSIILGNAKGIRHAANEKRQSERRTFLSLQA